MGLLQGCVVRAPAAFRRGAAAKIHDFYAYFGHKRRLISRRRHNEIGLNKRVDILANTCFLAPSRACAGQNHQKNQIDSQKKGTTANDSNCHELR
jgi:hypothetical protein